MPRYEVDVIGQETYTVRLTVAVSAKSPEQAAQLARFGEWEDDLGTKTLEYESFQPNSVDNIVEKEK